MTYGLILMGGHSVRFGTSKAFLRHPETQNFLWRELSTLLQQYCDRVFFSFRSPTQDRPKDIDSSQIIYDIQGKGPMAGVFSAFSHTLCSWLVCAIDMPFINDHLISTLMNARTPHADAVVYTSSHGIEPLSAVYEPSIYPALQDAVHTQQYGLQSLLHTVRTVHIPLPHTRLLTNINTQEDLHNTQVSCL